MLIAPKSKLLIIGDSVSDAGRGHPVGEGLFDAIGKGYIAQVDALLTATHPEMGIRVVNMGTSGNTVLDLKNRWTRDVIEQKPDWLAVMIGINDVWRQFDLPRQPETHVLPDQYEATYRQILAEVRPSLKGLILMTPYYIEPNTMDAMRAQMDKYGQIVRKLAREFDAVLVDTQAAFNTFLKTQYPATLSWDRVHPNYIGGMVLALAFLKAIEFKIN